MKNIEMEGGKKLIGCRQALVDTLVLASDCSAKGSTWNCRLEGDISSGAHSTNKHFKRGERKTITFNYMNLVPCEKICVLLAE